MNTNDKQNKTCACGATFPVHPAGYCGGTGYALKPNGERICYPCSDKQQIEELKDRSKPFVAYVGKGDAITTWTLKQRLKLAATKQNLEQLANEDGIQRGIFFDTSGNLRTERVSATSTHSWLFKTKAGQPFRWPLNNP